MNCSEVQRVLLEYVEGGLSTQEQHNIDEHIAKCSECAASVKRWRNAVTLLQSSPVQQPPEALFDRVLADAWANIGQNHTDQTDSSMTPQPRPLLLPNSAAATPKRRGQAAWFSMINEKNRHIAASLVASLLLFVLCELLLSSPAGAYPVIDPAVVDIQMDAVSTVFDFPRWWAEKSTGMWESWTHFFKAGHGR